MKSLFLSLLIFFGLISITGCMENPKQVELENNAEVTTELPKEFPELNTEMDTQLKMLVDRIILQKDIEISEELKRYMEDQVGQTFYTYEEYLRENTIISEIEHVSEFKLMLVSKYKYTRDKIYYYSDGSCMMAINIEESSDKGLHEYDIPLEEKYAGYAILRLTDGPKPVLRGFSLSREGKPLISVEIGDVSMWGPLISIGNLEMDEESIKRYIEELDIKSVADKF